MSDNSSLFSDQISQSSAVPHRPLAADSLIDSEHYWNIELHSSSIAGPSSVLERYHTFTPVLPPLAPAQIFGPVAVQGLDDPMVGEFAKSFDFLRDVRRTLAGMGVAPHEDLLPHEFAQVMRIVSGGVIDLPTQERLYDPQIAQQSHSVPNSVILRKRQRFESFGIPSPQPKRARLDIANNWFLGNHTDMNLPQPFCREIIVSQIEEVIPNSITPLPRRSFRDLCGRMRIYSLTSYFSMRCFEYMTGGCTQAILASIEAYFEEWSRLSFIQAVGKQAMIKAFLLQDLLVPAETKHTMSNHEKDEWQVWGDVLNCALEYDIRELEISLGETISKRLAMNAALNETLELPPDEITVVINVVEALVNRKGEHHRKFERFLKKLIDMNVQLPSSLLIKGVFREGKNPHSGGGFADVWKGVVNGFRVAIKVLRIYGTDPQTKREIEQECCKEAMIWRKFRHPNILPFLGICADEFAPQVALVSPWMENGNMHVFLKKNPSANRPILILGVARGLEYLHQLEPKVVHGDLRGANVLVDERGEAQLADFGLAKLDDSKATTLATSFKGKGSIRWQAPELLDSGKYGGISCGPSLSSDIYSFACLCIEIFTLKAPFMDLLRDYEVIMAVAVRDERPARPAESASEQGLSDGLWDLIQLCWAVEPCDRPSATQVLRRLQDIYPEYANHNDNEITSETFWDSLRRDTSFTLTFPDNFASVSALLERGERWHTGMLCGRVRMFEPTPQVCAMEKETRIDIDRHEDNEEITLLLFGKDFEGMF